ncbi:hypothetical protein [Dokdonella sp.]|uniref:hypothetical protein n=1 Tax=Dokdonella sp. TaxID=2291710 RepID=UPI001B19B324|nr:hypothetical protein [Dokdonella sp.]MBO9665146.1 glycosyltransferase family 39 protein [Dokdonella sp.]
MSGSTPTPAPGRALLLRLTLYGGVPLLAMLACAPLLDAGFQAEDFYWLALVRHLDAPLIPFYENVALAYFYRPIGLMFWELCTWLGGTDPWVHNLLDLLLHGVNALLIGSVATRLARDRRIGILAGVLFACLPATSGTALWTSDRFDPVCLFFGLLALHAFERALAGRRAFGFLAAASLALCLSSKEVGLAVAAAMLALLGWQWLRTRERRWDLLAMVLAPMAVVFVLHTATVPSFGFSLDGAQSLSALLGGVGYWWLRLPAAVFGFRPVGAGWWPLLATAALLALVGLARAIRQGQEGAVRLACVGAVMFVVPALLQWPVTRLALSDAAGLGLTINLRFYYLAFAGCALLWAAAIAGLRGLRSQWLLLAASLALALQGFAVAHRVARDWANETRAPTAAYLAMGEALGSRSFEPGCRIVLQTSGFPPEFVYYADVIVKAVAPRDSRVLDCAVFGDVAPYASIVDARWCSEDAWPGLAVRRQHGVRGLAQLGNLCILGFAEPPVPTESAELARFSVAADGRITPLPP